MTIDHTVDETSLETASMTNLEENFAANSGLFSPNSSIKHLQGLQIRIGTELQKGLPVKEREKLAILAQGVTESLAVIQAFMISKIKVK